MKLAPAAKLVAGMPSARIRVLTGATIAEVQVRMEERIAGTSYLTMGRSIMYMMRMLISILLIQNFRKRQKMKKIVMEEV